MRKYITGCMGLLAVVLFFSSGYFSIAWAEDSQVVFYEKQVKQMSTMFGPKHPSTLKSMNSLAIAYFKAGRYDEAAAMDGKTLSLRREVLGQQHPDTLNSMSNLANDYLAQGDIQALNSLAIEYEKIGRYQEAAALLERTLAFARRKLGETNTMTTLLRRNLGTEYYNLKRYRDAAALDEETLKVLRSRQNANSELLPGMEDLNTAQEIIDTMESLVRDYQALGNQEKAAAYEREIRELD